MHKNITIVVGVTILFLGMSITPSVAVDTIEHSSMPTSDGNTLYVGGTGPDNYSVIQHAVDNASSGDTVFVYNGTYYENLIMNKSIALVAEDRNTTVIDGSGVGNVVDINADCVTVNGFTLKHGYFFGIAINSNCSTITDNIISNNLNHGITLWHSNNNTLTGNNISNNGQSIEMYYSCNNTISDNTISNNDEGIYLFDSNNNTISSNFITKNKYEGINHFFCRSNIITNNTISYNRCGIDISASYFNTIKGNTISNNDDGILLGNSGFNLILKNNFLNNRQNAFFICLWYSNRNLWMLNYWNRPRILPKLIMGRLAFQKYIPWIPQIDWRPAKEPYDI